MAESFAGLQSVEVIPEFDFAMFVHALQLTTDFTGDVRLFPLPDLVLFPGAIQPLHIFEPRYCEMLDQALASDHLIAMATLVSSSESSTIGTPPISPYICIGRVVAHEANHNGTHDILLAGLQRARIDGEIPSENAFREATVIVLEDESTNDIDDEDRQILRELLNSLKSSDAQLTPVDLPTGRLTDALAFHLRFPLDFKQMLLAEADVAARARIIQYAVESRGADRFGGRRRPFSKN